MRYMDKKQTAVEWLLNILITENEITLKGENYKLFDMAIRMEKEQLIDAYTEGYDIRDNMGSLLTNPTGEQYYNETYGKTRTTG